MYGFEVDFLIDDAGVETFYAWQAEDFNTRGMPRPGAIKGAGDTPHEAIANLCLKIVEEGFAVEELA